MTNDVRHRNENAGYALAPRGAAGRLTMSLRALWARTINTSRLRARDAEAYAWSSLETAHPQGKEAREDRLSLVEGRELQ